MVAAFILLVCLSVGSPEWSTQFVTLGIRIISVKNSKHAITVSSLATHLGHFRSPGDYY